MTAIGNTTGFNREMSLQRGGDGRTMPAGQRNYLISPDGTATPTDHPLSEEELAEVDAGNGGKKKKRGGFSQMIQNR